MAEFPALPLWTDAYLADTGHLTFEEHGLYLNLLILMWRSPECRIPNDPDWLNRRFPDHANALRSLCQEFCITDAQWIWQKRLQKEWRWCKDKKHKNKLAAEARWSKTLDKTDANASFAQCERNAPIPTPTPLKNDDDASAKSVLISQEAFEVEKEMGKIIGIDPDFVPPAWFGAPHKIQAWLSGGWPAESIITSTRMQMGARNGKPPPSTASYFEKGIADFIANNARPIPIGTKNGSSSGTELSTAGYTNGQSRSGNRQTQDDIILAGMRLASVKMAGDRQREREANALSSNGDKPNGSAGE